MATFTIAERNADHARAVAVMLVRIARETGDVVFERPVRGATPAGDEQRLRGIPALGRGVAGAIAGTRPERIAE